MVSCLSLASFGDSDALEAISSTSHVSLTPTSMAAVAAALPKVLALGRKRKRIHSNNNRNNNNGIKSSLQEITISLQGGEIARGGSDEMDPNSFLTNFQDQVSDMRKQLEDETFAKLRRLKEELRAQKSKAEGNDNNAVLGKQRNQAVKRNSPKNSSPNAGRQHQLDYVEEVEDYSDGNNNYGNNQDWSDYDDQNSVGNQDYYPNGGDTTDNDYHDMMRQPTWNEADHQAPKIIVGGGAIGVQPPGFRKTAKRNGFAQPTSHRQRQDWDQMDNGSSGSQYGAQLKRVSGQASRHRGNQPDSNRSPSHRARPSNYYNSDGVMMNPYQQQQQQQQQMAYPHTAVSDKWRTATMGLLLIVLGVFVSMIWNAVMGNG